MKWATYITLLIALASNALADDRKSFEPLSLDPPPKAIEGLRLGDVVDFFKTHNYRDAIGKVYFCPPCGLYLWSGLASDHTGTVVVKSYTGNVEVVGLRLQADGFIESTPGNPPENMRELIAKVSENAQAVCVGDQNTKVQFAELFAGRLTKLVYEAKGTQSSKERDVMSAEDAFLFGGLRIHLTSSYRANSSIRGLWVEISAAEHRTWADTTGKFQVAAAYLSHNSSDVTLVKEDGQQVRAPLSKLCAEDLKWLDATQHPVPDLANTNTQASKTDQAKRPTTRWLNTSYDTTIYQIAEGRWAERDNKTQKVKWQLKETGCDGDSIELYLADRDQIVRLTATRMEIKKENRWEWLSNGKWIEPSRKR
jgi:hypothetical protein